ncbi:putative odorant receptor 92a [Leptopilina boulardi]|uniref:putative odorant receptor 92a n=1 Tax=Leptopilina boulardi TaxID=63433 RepID=UPI0021F65B0E|nr:putative odorant receptor 92a [Leptopilina boulardi]
MLCCLSFLSALCLLIPLCNSVYQDWSDRLIMTKSICLACPVLLVAMKILICRFQRHRFKILLQELIKFLKEANKPERKVIDYYVKKHVFLNLSLSITGFLTALIFVIGPFLLSTPLPTDAKYPFLINSSFRRFIIYLHQSIVAFQVASTMVIDCLCASLLWFTAARFEILSQDFKNIQSESDVYLRIRQHQYLLIYAKTLRIAIRGLVFSTLLTATTAIVFASVPFFTPASLMIKAQFAFIVCSAGTLVFLTAWPADHLIITTSKIGTAAFNSSWIGLPPKLLKCWILILKMSQKPITINIAGILPTLSLPYFFQFVSKVFSYLATLRIIIMKEIVWSGT